jgi:hypothetical protein
MVSRALTFLNEQGDLTITWEEAQDEKMESIIQKKMDEGFVFFIIKPRARKKTELTSVKDAFAKRTVYIKDEDISKFIEEGHGTVVKTPETSAETVRRGKTAKEVASSESVGMRQRRGG